MQKDLFIVPGAAQWFVSQLRHPNSVMYHYTSRRGLEGILSTRRMWAGDLRSMNDPKELVLGKREIDKRIVKAAQRFRASGVEAWLQTVRKQFVDLVVKRSSTFSISLSEHHDLAHQWRDYAEEGTGFVLGWSIDSDYPGTPLKTWVTYDRMEQRRLLDGIIDFHVRYLAMSITATSSPAERERLWIGAGYSLFRFLNAVWLTFKEEQWAPEAEFRYVYHVWDEYLPDWCEIKTRPGAGVARKYIEADFRPAELRYIVIGPGNDRAEARRWVRALLDTFHYSGVTIVESGLRAEDVVL